MTEGRSDHHGVAAGDAPVSLYSRAKFFLFGKPRDLHDKSIFHQLSLIPFLAWVGLGADGLSSSAYGPEEAFKTLGEHGYMAVGLALVMGLTIVIISLAYSRIIEAFPHGGGGYVVASKLLGPKVGVVSGCALLVDYVLTITVSIAASGDAIFSLLPLPWHVWKMPVEVGLIVGLMAINIRGVKESVMALTPIFIVFLITHAVAIAYGIGFHIPEFPATALAVSHGFSSGWEKLGPLAMALLFIHAYSLGGGTYTGIEAVSNGLPMMREPRVATAKRTMVYMALSLAITASGLLLCYLLWGITPVEGKTMNAVLIEKMTSGLSMGQPIVVLTLLAEGLLLVVAGQTGFLDGPRVLANMANDSWMPRRFGALSERLTTSNGIVLMGVASVAALLYTKGNVAHLVVMYSINVFLTFSLSIFGMWKQTAFSDRSRPRWTRDMALFFIGFMMCAIILVITVLEKFGQGGWITLAVTGGLVLLCFWIKGHYLETGAKLAALYTGKETDLSRSEAVKNLHERNAGRTAVVLVGGFGGLGINTVESILTSFPGVFGRFIFVSVGVVDSGAFKGEEAIEELESETEAMLQKYVTLAKKWGIKGDCRASVGTDVVQEASMICLDIARETADVTFFTGKIIFTEEKWYQRLLHNETGLALQKRLQIAGHTMVVLPAKVT